MYSYSPFRNQYAKEGLSHEEVKKVAQSCVFCDEEIINAQIIRNADGVAMRGKYYMWLSNEFPKFEGHTLIVPITHIETLTADEANASLREKHDLMVLAQNTLQKVYPGCGVEIFAQNGPGSESSVPHVHWHIVPAQPDDLLRSFAKLGHFYTTNEDEKLVVDFPVRIRYAREELREKFAQVLGSKVLGN